MLSLSSSPPLLFSTSLSLYLFVFGFWFLMLDLKRSCKNRADIHFFPFPGTVVRGITGKATRRYIGKMRHDVFMFFFPLSLSSSNIHTLIWFLMNSSIFFTKSNWIKFWNRLIYKTDLRQLFKRTVPSGDGFKCFIQTVMVKIGYVLEIHKLNTTNSTVFWMEYLWMIPRNIPPIYWMLGSQYACVVERS